MSSDDTLPAGLGEPAVALRRTLQAVAAATPTPDRSAELLAALDERITIPPAERPDADPAAAGGVDGPLAPMVPNDGRRPGAGRWLLVAAAMLVVVALAVAVSRRGSEETGVVNQPAEGPATGWFLPGREWEITSVQTDFLDVGEEGFCPCTLWVAGRPGSEPAVLDVVESAAPIGGLGEDDLVDGREQVDVGGRLGQVGGFGPQGAELVQVISGDRMLTLNARAVDRAQTIAVADAWLDRTDAGDRVDVDALPLPDGFEHSGAVAKFGTLEHLLIIRAREATTGDEVDYQLVPTGYNRFTLLSADTLRFDEGIFEATSVEPSTGDPYVTRVVGPVDLLAGSSFFGEPIEPLSEPALERFVESLHEVTTPAWREALAAAEGEVDPDVLVAPSLFDPPLTDR